MNRYIVSMSRSDIVANVLVCNILVSEIDFKSRYFVQFRTNISGKDKEQLIPTATG